LLGFVLLLAMPAPAAAATGGTIQVTISAADDLSVHPSVCLFLLPARKGAMLKTDQPWYGYCGDTGSITIGAILDEQVYLIALTPDFSGYGAQWVGPGGGTGRRESAQVFTITEGSTVQAQVRLDHSGSINGAVYSVATGAFASACARVLPYRISGYTDNCSSRTSGHFKVRDLGPYAWPVEVDADPSSYGDNDQIGSYAVSWSGNAASRDHATLMQVIAGQSVSMPDTLLTAPGKIAVTTAEPRTFQAYDVITFDRIPISQTYANGVEMLSGFNTHPVALWDYNSRCWIYRPTIGRFSTYQIPVTAGATTTLSLAGTTCRQDLPVRSMVRRTYSGTSGSLVPRR
jgi:hypothetical protein